MPPDIIQTQQEVARKALAPKVTYINPELKQISAIAQDFLDAFWVEQQKDLDQVVATIIANIGRELEAMCEGMPDMYPLDIFPEPWDYWEKDVDELAKSHGQRIDRISAHYARWQHKVTKDDVLTLIRSITGISPTR